MLDLILATYQWLMYALLLGLSASCVIGGFFKDAHDELRRTSRPQPRRSSTTIRFLRPIPRPSSP